MGTTHMPSVPGKGKRQAPEAWTFLTTIGLLSKSQTVVLVYMTSSGAALRASPSPAHTQPNETFIGDSHLAVSLMAPLPLLSNRFPSFAVMFDAGEALESSVHHRS